MKPLKEKERKKDKFYATIYVPHNNVPSIFDKDLLFDLNLEPYQSNYIS